MLVPNLLPKVVPHSGSRLLPRFIVRNRGRLVASKPRLDPTPSRSPRPSRRLRGPHTGHPRPVAALSQRAQAGALQEGRGDLFSIEIVENKGSPLYRALSRYTYTNTRDRQVYRVPTTEVGLAGRLKISRPTLWRWRKAPHFTSTTELRRSPVSRSSFFLFMRLMRFLRSCGVGVLVRVDDSRSAQGHIQPTKRRK
jgi:hypothetical protein